MVFHHTPRHRGFDKCLLFPKHAIEVPILSRLSRQNGGRGDECCPSELVELKNVSSKTLFPTMAYLRAVVTTVGLVRVDKEGDCFVWERAAATAVFGRSILLQDLHHCIE